MNLIHVLEQQDYKPGDREPAGASYLAWHEWAEVQYLAGLRQQQCGRCGKWRYPQDMSALLDRGELQRATRAGMVPEVVATPVCLMCEPGAGGGGGSPE